MEHPLPLWGRSWTLCSLAGHTAERQRKELDGALMNGFNTAACSLLGFVSIPSTCDSLILGRVGIRKRGPENDREGTNIMTDPTQARLWC